MDYTGIETIYEATDALTGERRVYNSKEDMDMQVKLKLASDPEVRVEEDKQPGIYLLLIQLCYQDEEYDQALEYCQKALKKYPKDKDIFLLEGQIQYQKGDLDKFLETCSMLKRYLKAMPKSSTTSVLFMEKRATKPSRSNTTRKPSKWIPSMSMRMSTWLLPC